MGLKADHVVDRAVGVVAPQLHHGVILLPGARIPEAHGLERPVAQRVHAPAGHDLDGHAALEDRAVVKAVHRRFLRAYQRVDKGEILVPVHRAVYIIRSISIPLEGSSKNITLLPPISEIAMLIFLL